MLEQRASVWRKMDAHAEDCPDDLRPLAPFIPCGLIENSSEHPLPYASGSVMLFCASGLTHVPVIAGAMGFLKCLHHKVDSVDCNS